MSKSDEDIRKTVNTIFKKFDLNQNSYLDGI